MPKRPQLAPVLTQSGWMVSIPPALSGRGVRERKFFREERDAKRFASSLRGSYARGERGGIIDVGLARMAAEAAEMLAPLGMSILDAAKSAVARAGTASTETLAQRYAAATLANEGRWRARYAQDMSKVPSWVGADIMAMRIDEITRDDVIAALRGNGAAAQSTIDARGLRVWSIIHYRPRHHKIATIAIMSPAECGRMLRACESPAERRAVALMIWAGIRPDAESGEIARLDWVSVGADIYVSAEVSKTKSDRHIPITPRLARLLRGHPPAGPVTPANWKRVYQRLRRAAGITAQDITRHTFASNFLAAHGEDAAKQAMGHTAGSSTLFRHYRRAVTAEAGMRFFR